MNLQDIYREYNTKNIYPFHMPGHKRNTELMQMDNPYSIDYTEIDGLDNLHDACAHPYRDSIIANAMRRASRLFHSKMSFYLINGSSSGLIAGILALSRRGHRVLIPRNCHLSLYNALALGGVKPVYIYPSLDEQTGIYAQLDPKDVEKAFEEHPDIKLVVVVSPTFNGVVSDIESIARIAHKHDALVMVDEAHGPHLSVSDYFPASAVVSGADLVIQSLHKTLPVLTQASILHICSDRVDPEAIQRQLAVIESTSPSYILMASCDQCVDLLEKRGPELFEIYHQRLEHFSEQMKDLKHLTVLCKGNDHIEDHPNIFRYDQGKIMVSTRGTNITGAELYQILLDKYRLQFENKLNDLVLAMTSIADTQEGFDRLAEALLEIDSTLEDVEAPERIPIRHNVITVPSLSPSEAYDLDPLLAPPEDSIGRIAREYVYAYPPGIPYIVPGEIITSDTLEVMQRMEASGIRLYSTRHRYPTSIEICQQ